MTTDGCTTNFRDDKKARHCGGRSRSAKQASGCQDVNRIIFDEPASGICLR